MKYLIVGASGFIGSNLALKLLEGGHIVYNYDIHAPFFESSLVDKINEYRINEQYVYIQGDMGSKVLSGLIVDNDIDGVFHLGGVLGTAETLNSIEFTANTNIIKTLNVFDAIKWTNRKAVYIGIGNDWENPYTITKVAAARFALMYNREMNTKITVVRGLNVYGPRQKWFPVNKYFPRFVVSILKNEKIPIFGDGEQVIDVVYVDDVCEALIKAMETDFGKDQYEQILDAGTGEGITVNETVRLILKVMNREAKFDSLVEYRPMRKGEPIRSKTLGNTSSINKILGFVPKTEISKGISDSVEWYKKYYKELEEYAGKF